MTQLTKSIAKLKLFFALSRTPHAILDMATPALCALLWLGAFPSLKIIMLGLITAFAGYTAIYALNDLIGYRIDRKKMSDDDIYQRSSVESSNLRHPIAQNLLSVNMAILWIVFWFIISLTGAYFLNSITVLILLTGGVLEIIYCLLLKVTYLRTIISGVVKTCGPIAAIFAVDPSPNKYFLFVLFFWVFLWEIGGQNIPADWIDIKEDKRAMSKTIPICFSLTQAGIIVCVTLILAVIVNCYLLFLSPITYTVSSIIFSLLIGAYFLLFPAYRLFRFKNSAYAAKLFDKASYYPLALLLLITLTICMVR